MEISAVLEASICRFSHFLFIDHAYCLEVWCGQYFRSLVHPLTRIKCYNSRLILSFGTVALRDDSSDLPMDQSDRKKMHFACRQHDGRLELLSRAAGRKLESMNWSLVPLATTTEAPIREDIPWSSELEHFHPSSTHQSTCGRHHRIARVHL